MSEGSVPPQRGNYNFLSGDVSGTVVQVGLMSGGDIHLSYPTRVPERLSVPLPYRYGAVPLHAPVTQPRDLSRVLAEVLERGDTAVLSGPGGMGKTRLAAEYTTARWQTGDVDLVAWVDASSREAVVAAYADLHANLTSIEETVPGRGARRLLDWLAQTGLRWVVVLDDVLDPAAVSDLWPPSTPSGRLVVTTRRRDADLRRVRRRLIHVGALSPREAHSYLTRVVRDGALDGAAELARELGHVPLALAQAAAYLGERHLSCARYLTELSGFPRTAGGPVRAEPAPVAATCALSLDLAAKSAPVGVARPLLEITSVLDPTSIPEALLGTPDVLDLLSTRAGRPVRGDDLADVLDALEKLSLLDVDLRFGRLSVRSHGVVQQVVRDALPPEALRVVALTAASALVERWHGADGPEAARVLRANTDALARVAGHHLWAGGCHEVLVLRGRSLGEDGFATEARDYFRGLHAMAGESLGADHPDTFTLAGQLAHWTGMAGNAPRAAALFAEVAADRARVLGPHHPDTLAARHNRASWIGESGDPKGAVAAFSDVSAARARVLGPDHPDTLASWDSLAQWTGIAGDLPGAVAAFEELTRAYDRVLGPDHPDAFNARLNLAHWIGNSGDPVEATGLLERLLDDQSRVLGPFHPYTLATLHGLADWRGAAGDPAAAVAELERLLEMRVRVLGPDHPDTLATHDGLAEWRSAAGDVRGALLEVESLHRARLSALGPDHPNTLVAESSLAVLLQRSGDLRRAAYSYRNVLERRRRVLGEEHPDTMRSAANLAVVLRQLGEYESARALDGEVLERRRRVLGDDHPDTRRSASNTEAEAVLGVPDVVVVHFDGADAEVAAVVDGLQAAGMVVGSAMATGGPHGREAPSEPTDALVVVVTGEASPGHPVRRDIESALAGDVPVVVVYAGVSPTAAAKSLPYGLARKRGIAFDLASRDPARELVDAVRRAVRVRGPRERLAGPGRLDPVELDDLRTGVAEAFGAAGRPVRPDPGQPQVLLPGPVWVSAEVTPSAAEVDRFAAHLAHGRLGYFVHVGDLRGDAQVVLDQMRVGGKPVVTVTARALRAAHADQHVDAFLNELERDYGNHDNLFDTRNALINERFLFGRDVLLNTIGSAIRRHEHVLVTGLRKVGKTSLLNILRQHLADRPVCQVDLQRFDRHHEDWPPALFALLLAAFDRWGRAEHRGWPFRTPSPTTTTELERELDRRQQHLRDSGHPATTLVVVLDELERVYPARGEVHAARQWVRASGALRALAQGDRRHVVVIGADLRPDVNRDNDLGVAGTNPFFSFFQEMPVPLLEERAVDEMVGTLGRAMGIDRVSEEFTSGLFRLTGGHPSLVRTVAAEAYRRRELPYELTAADLVTAQDHLDDADTVGFFLRNNLWQLMTVAEREVVRAVVGGRPVADFVPATDRKQARSALRSQGLLDGEDVRIGVFRDWLREAEP
ncbi:tetratricopeptide repeat protein [Saccharothrix sp. Mg75]|uniref:tetratricopeptide repeat protein n=1 Tax=Saccharothrix sp. Mg75 TaxID=3445357 RepID=UPI003EEDB66B